VKNDVQKNVKNSLRAPILVLLAAFGAARGVPRAPQERPKTAPRSEEEWFPHALCRSWVPLGAFLRFLAILYDFLGFVVDFWSKKLCNNLYFFLVVKIYHEKPDSVRTYVRTTWPSLGALGRFVAFCCICWRFFFFSQVLAAFCYEKNFATICTASQC
jgi:hypothetical protein